MNKCLVQHWLLEDGGVLPVALFEYFVFPSVFVTALPPVLLPAAGGRAAPASGPPPAAQCPPENFVSELGAEYPALDVPIGTGAPRSDNCGRPVTS